MTNHDLLPQHIIDGIEAGGLEVSHVLGVINRAIDEDLQWGPDVTTNSIFSPDQVASAKVVSREHGALAGVPVGLAALHVFAARNGADVTTTILLGDGSVVEPGSVVADMTAPLPTLLTAERTLLNLMSQLSGVASATHAWATALKGTGARIRDTRKTVPGLRVLQKYAVRCGGGVNHRMGVGDEALIKDNHIAEAGSITEAVEAIRAAAPDIFIEVECDNLDQVREAIDAGVELVLLDNMSPEEMREAVAITKPAGVKTEASGGLTIDDAEAVGAVGVDYVAVGALTHSAKVLDLGLDIS